ncbi:MAG: putative DNA-binding helix-hairpin-helix protein [Yoonia sp.]|jgi:predicted DNA-binding helix-hairpin-helix protein
MAQFDFHKKLAIQSRAARYDAFCASSETKPRDCIRGGLGSTEGSGICHSYALNDRCISLLKILMTKFCIYDCAYCINRVSSHVKHARFTRDEVVQLTIEFNRRNYIDGLFLSSGVIQNPDKTMEDMVEIARRLRNNEVFKGYIHLKTIPDANQVLIGQAGLFANPLSINVELPTHKSVHAYAPEKSPVTIRRVMGAVSEKRAREADQSFSGKRPPQFASAGQSTQMIVGADHSTGASIRFPFVKPLLIREHRLYQANWLLRFYGFKVEEITAARADGHLDLEIDPKLVWALQNRALFPTNANKASWGLSLRVPDFRTKTLGQILQTRRHRTLRYEVLLQLGTSLKKAQPFIAASGWTLGALTDAVNLRTRYAPPPKQLQLF